VARLDYFMACLDLGIISHRQRAYILSYAHTHSLRYRHMHNTHTTTYNYVCIHTSTYIVICIYRHVCVYVCINICRSLLPFKCPFTCIHKATEQHILTGFFLAFMSLFYMHTVTEAYRSCSFLQCVAVCRNVLRYDPGKP